MLTLLAYYQTGLTESQMRSALQALGGLEQSARESRFKCVVHSSSVCKCAHSMQWELYRQPQ